MKKKLLFLVGFLIGPLLIIAIGILFFSEPSKREVTDNYSVFPMKVRFDSPLPFPATDEGGVQLAYLVTTNTKPWVEDLRVLVDLQPIEAKGWPIETTLYLDRAAFERLLANKDIYDNPQNDSKDIAFNFFLITGKQAEKMSKKDPALGSGSAQRMYLPPGANVAPYSLKTEVVSAISVKNFIQERKPKIDLGTVYFPEAYKIMNPLNKAICPKKILRKVHIMDLRGELEKIRSKMSVYLVRMPDDFQQNVISEGIYRELNKKSHSPFVGIPIIKNEFDYMDISPESIDGGYSYYFAVFCERSKPKNRCLDEFADTYLRFRKRTVPGKYNFLVPRDGVVTRCDQQDVNLYYYPYKKDFRRGEAYLPHQEDPAMPSEIIDVR